MTRDDQLTFVVRGTVDGRPTVARWCDGTLDADPEIRRRAEVIVAMGDRFVTEDGYAVQASLAGGFATVLTIIRAFSTVTSLDLPVGAFGAEQEDRARTQSAG